MRRLVGNGGGRYTPSTMKRPAPIMLLPVCASALVLAVACGSDDSAGGPAGTGGAAGGNAGTGGAPAGGSAGAGGGGAVGGGAGASSGGANSGGANSGGASSGGASSGGTSGVDLGCGNDPAVPFKKEQDVSVGKITGLSALDLADVNGDGRLDIGVFEGGKHGKGGVNFAWLEAPAGAGAWTQHNLPKPSPFKPFIGAAKFGDVNKDGKPDVVVSMDEHSGAPPSAYIYWLQNPGASGTWTIHKIASNLAVEHINDMELADMDGDGKLDVVVRSLSPNQLLFFFQDGADAWQQRVFDAKPYGATGEGFAVGDIDRKGKLDVTICGHWLAAPANPRSGAYAAHTIDAGYKAVNANVKEAIGDLNGDGRNDVILSPAEGYRNGKNHVLAWYEAPADPTAVWTQHVLAKNFNGGHTVRLADIDGDADLDVISGVAWSMWGQTANVTVYRNCGGVFGKAEVVVSGKGLYTGVVGDIGADGDMDIVGQNTYSASSHPYLYESTASGK